MNEGDGGRRVVDGRFGLEARLGGGGMGTVWRARDLLLHRGVAVKEVRPADPGLAEYDPPAARLLRARVLRGPARWPGSRTRTSSRSTTSSTAARAHTRGSSWRSSRAAPSPTTSPAAP
ncbi:hypothetical protein [Streptomyces sp. NPDC087212]|uniref:hypothetical protein n=1 Tax=Streptomyces sp. NPDC087212 TaxID=3365766 RepID=UPI00381881F0